MSSKLSSKRKAAVLMLAALGLGAVPAPATACPPRSQEDRIASDKRVRDSALEAIAAMKEDADQIFVGRLLAASAHDRHVEDRVHGYWIAVVYAASFEVDAQIKGAYASGKTLQRPYLPQLERAFFCHRVFESQRALTDKEIGKTFLVYVKDEVILRLNMLEDRRSVVRLDEEIKLLRTVSN